MVFDGLAAIVLQLLDVSNIILLQPAAVHRAKSRIVDPIPNAVIRIFHWLNH